jgi:hypothetical protein
MVHASRRADDPGRRPGRRGGPRPAPGPGEPAAGTPQPAARSWQGVTFRAASPGAVDLRRLFDFAGAPAPPASPGELAWEALTGEQLVGGTLVERRGEHGFVHGPVVVEPPAGVEPLDVAAQLVAALLDQATTLRMTSLFTRPQGLDRVWVRLGFVPVPEAFLPEALRGRPGTGLHAWRRPGTYTITPPDVEGRRGRRG